MEVDVKGIQLQTRNYFFAKKNIKKSEKTKLLSDLLEYVSKDVRQVINNSRSLNQRFIEKMPWNIKGIFLQFIGKGKKSQPTWSK